MHEEVRQPLFVAFGEGGLALAVREVDGSGSLRVFEPDDLARDLGVLPLENA
jgi:flagellar biosynthesis protein FlhB